MCKVLYAQESSLSSRERGKSWGQTKGVMRMVQGEVGEYVGVHSSPHTASAKEIWRVYAQQWNLHEDWVIENKELTQGGHRANSGR